jgi:CheY-like chemotaxis protein
MTRPCFLVIDREYAGSISTRKLVIETAKLNVITAYSGAEAIAMMERFPKVDGVILDLGVSDIGCDDLVKRLKAIHNVPVIAIGTPQAGRCDGADHFFEAFEPAKLLGLIGKLVPAAERVMDREKTGFSTEV